MRACDLLCGALRAFIGMQLSHWKGRSRSPVMNESLSVQLDELRSFTIPQLRKKHIDLFGEPTGSRHKQQMLRKIGWRLQVLAEGGLSERARRRALEIAHDADLRVLPPKHSREESDRGARVSLRSARDRRIPEPGTVLVRDFKGKRISVTVLEDGFEYEGRVFKSLSAIAQKATDSSWNGYTFFHLARVARGDA
jgi:hypothetical protein